MTHHTNSTAWIRSALAILLGALVVVPAWRTLVAPDAKAEQADEVSTAMSSVDVVEAKASPVANDANAERPPDATEQSPEFLDIDPAKAFRASPSLRADDARRLRDATDLADFGTDLSARALKGDADAAQALADLLRHCGMAYAFDQPEAWRHLQFYGQLDEAQMQAVAQAMRAQQSRCSTFARSDPEWYAWQAQRWNNLAAELGSPVASAERLPENLRTPGAQLAYADAQRAALTQVLDESDAEALARHATALAYVSGLRFEAFAIAACTLNPACAADPRAYPLRMGHSGQFGSNPGSGYWGLRMMTPREHQVAQGQAQHILRLWRARRFAELVAAQTPIAPGGP